MERNSKKEGQVRVCCFIGWLNTSNYSRVPYTNALNQGKQVRIVTRKLVRSADIMQNPSQWFSTAVDNLPFAESQQFRQPTAYPLEAKMAVVLTPVSAVSEQDKGSDTDYGGVSPGEESGCEQQEIKTRVEEQTTGCDKTELDIAVAAMKKTIQIALPVSTERLFVLTVNRSGDYSLVEQHKMWVSEVRVCDNQNRVNCIAAATEILDVCSQHLDKILANYPFIRSKLLDFLFNTANHVSELLSSYCVNSNK